MKAMKRLVCLMLAVLSAFAFCACGEGHPMYKDFKFIQTEWQGDFDTGLQVEVKNVSGCTYQSVNLYAGDAKFDVNTGDKVRKTEKVKLYFKGQYEVKDITFASKETTFPELVKYFEVANLTLTYKKDGENRSSYMFYNVEKDEYNVV